MYRSSDRLKDLINMYIINIIIPTLLYRIGQLVNIAKFYVYGFSFVVLLLA